MTFKKYSLQPEKHHKTSDCNVLDSALLSISISWDSDRLLEHKISHWNLSGCTCSTIYLPIWCRCPCPWDWCMKSVLEPALAQPVSSSAFWDKQKHRSTSSTTWDKSFRKTQQHFIEWKMKMKENALLIKKHTDQKMQTSSSISANHSRLNTLEMQNQLFHFTA